MHGRNGRGTGLTSRGTKDLLVRGRCYASVGYATTCANQSGSSNSRCSSRTSANANGGPSGRSSRCVGKHPGLEVGTGVDRVEQRRRGGVADRAQMTLRAREPVRPGVGVDARPDGDRSGRHTHVTAVGTLHHYLHTLRHQVSRPRSCSPVSSTFCVRNPSRATALRAPRRPRGDEGPDHRRRSLRPCYATACVR